MEPRKASEVLLELEAKIDVLMSIVRTQDLNIKILSNKINSLIERAGQLPDVPSAPVPQMRIEAFDPQAQQIPISPDDTLPMESEPKGFRRTSRPETYAGDGAYLKPPVPPKFPVQVPKPAEVIVPHQATQQGFIEVPPPPKVAPVQTLATVPVVQRIVDKNGKSVFLADVEILESATKQTVAKMRTNGAGKWMASLPVGEYKVFIRKRESVNKEKMELVQTVQVDGTKSPLELQMVIIK